MTASNFSACLEHVLAHEGGYVDHPKDPGGATNMGITRNTLAAWRGRSVSKDEVRNLTKTEAAAIYRANYWTPVGGDDLPAGLDYVAFDGAVNSGVSRGAKWVQGALGVNQDGKVGPQTISAAHRLDPRVAINRACDARMNFLRSLGTWGTFGRGWTRRVDDVRAAALAMAGHVKEAPKSEHDAGDVLTGNGFWATLAMMLAGIFRGR